MQASFLDLRRHMRAILAALDRNEPVTLTYRGRPRAVITRLPPARVQSAAEHPAVGMWRDRRDLADPVQFVKELRRGRRHAL